MLKIAIITAAVICVILLYIVYRSIAKKSIFALFCILFAALLGLTAYMFRAPAPINNTLEHQQELAQQRDEFDAWYTKYKKAIFQIDYIWQQYHNALNSYDDESADLSETYQQLTKLENDSKGMLEELNRLQPQDKLGENIYKISVKLLDKAQDYTQSQFEAIHKSRLASDPKSLMKKGSGENGAAAAGPLAGAMSITKQEQLHKEISQALNHIMLTESPEGLFIADEIMAIRQYFKFPEE